MNIENLIVVTFGLTIFVIMMSAILNRGSGLSQFRFVGKACWAGICSFALGYIGGGFTTILGDVQMGMLIGIVAGQVLGYTNLMTRFLKFIWNQIVRFVKWIWGIATWWVKALIIIAIMAIILWFVFNHII